MYVLILFEYNTVYTKMGIHKDNTTNLFWLTGEFGP